jgi:hypothetical protein
MEAIVAQLQCAPPGAVRFELLPPQPAETPAPTPAPAPAPAPTPALAPAPSLARARAPTAAVAPDDDPWGDDSSDSDSENEASISFGGGPPATGFTPKAGAGYNPFGVAANPPAEPRPAEPQASER